MPIGAAMFNIIRIGKIARTGGGLLGHTSQYTSNK
jgi:hypothetical protein